MKQIPVLFAKGKSLAEAYENALVELYTNGGRMSTQYDKVGDPQSIDATLNIIIEEPLSDPMIHKAFIGGISDLREYVYELEGAKDNWIKNMDDPKDTKWEYTYSGRLRRYGSWKESDKLVSGFKDNRIINQVDWVIDKLSKQPHTRQAQIVTWMCNLDMEAYDCPCLQRLWYRIVEEEGIYYLNCNVNFRSNDAVGAFPFNAFGFIMFNRDTIAKGISDKTGKEVKLARMNWQADSWHIYGKDIQGIKERLFDRIATSTFEDRVYNFYDPDIQEMYRECEPDILKKIADKNAEFDKNNS
jgi:thymidylate synthase